MKWYDILIWILFILSILVVLWYFFGNSPTLEEAILVLLLTLTITSIIRIKEVGFKLNSLENKFSRLENSFIKLVNDFNAIKHKLRFT